ncbi:MAG: InlB B-repeat-containing protein [Clostridiales bacterium]|nr:InlB B-repeat-containing protein [Clostridiales bacterium]
MKRKNKLRRILAFVLAFTVMMSGTSLAMSDYSDAFDGSGGSDYSDSIHESNGNDDSGTFTESEGPEGNDDSGTLNESEESDYSDIPNESEGNDVYEGEDTSYFEEEEELSSSPQPEIIGITPHTTRIVTIYHGGGGFLQGNIANESYEFEITDGQSFFGAGHLLSFSEVPNGRLVDWMVTEVTYSGPGILPVVDEPFSVTDPITAGDITVVGDWVFLRTVTFDLNGGNIGGSTVNPTAQVWDRESINSTTDPVAVMPENPVMTGDGAPEFSHWVVTSATGDDGPQAGQTFTSATEIDGSNVTVQAVWNVDRTITFNLAGGTIGGSSTTPPVIVREGQSINQASGAVMPANPIREVNNVATHQFARWEVSVSPDGVTPNVGDPFAGGTEVSGGDITVTAIWTPYRTVTFNLGGGYYLEFCEIAQDDVENFNPVTRRVLDGAVVGTANMPPAPTHPEERIFSHWEVTTSPEGASPNVGHTLAATGNANQIRGGDITVTAMWRADRTISFNPGANDAIIPGEVPAVTPGAIVTRTVQNQTALNNPANSHSMPQRPTRDGWTFLYWRVTTSPAGVTPNNNTAFTEAIAVTGGNITVTAQWRETRTITFNPGASNATIPGAAAGANVTRDIANATAITNAWNRDAAGAQLTIPGNPTRPGHIFMGWRVTESPTGVTPDVDPNEAFTDGTIVTGGNITVTALWGEARTITFTNPYGNGYIGGQPGPVTRVVADGTYINAEFNEGEMPWGANRPGYTFLRWEVMTSPAGVTPNVNQPLWGNTPVSGGNITVRPVFTVLSVRFDLAGGNIGGNENDVLVPVDAWSSIAETFANGNPNSVMPPNPVRHLPDPDNRAMGFVGWQIIESHGGARPYIGTFFDENSIVANGTVVVTALWSHPDGVNPIVGLLFEERFEGNHIRDYIVRVQLNETLNNTPTSMIPAMPTVHQGREFRGWVVRDPLANPSLTAGAPFTGDEVITSGVRPSAIMETSWSQRVTFLPNFSNPSHTDPVTRMVLASNGRMVDADRPTDLPPATHPPAVAMPDANTIWGDRAAAGYVFDGWRVTIGCGTTGADAIAVNSTFTATTHVPFFSGDITVEATWRPLARVTFDYNPTLGTSAPHPSWLNPTPNVSIPVLATPVANVNTVGATRFNARTPAINTNHGNHGYIFLNWRVSGVGTRFDAATPILVGGVEPVLTGPEASQVRPILAATTTVTGGNITVAAQWQRLSRVSFVHDHPYTNANFTDVNNVWVQMNPATNQAAARHTVGAANMPNVSTTADHYGYVFEGWRVTSATQHTTGVRPPVTVGGVAPVLTGPVADQVRPTLTATTQVIGGDITVTGQWRRLATVTFESEGNGFETPSPVTRRVQPIDDTVGTPNIPHPGTLPARGFINWRVTSVYPFESGGEVLVNGVPAVIGATFTGAMPVVGGNITVTAAFQGVNRNVTFDPVNGTWGVGGNSDPQTFVFEDGAPLTESLLNLSPVPPAGYFFDRWIVTNHTNPGTPAVGDLLYIGTIVSGGNVWVTAEYLPLRTITVLLDGGLVDGLTTHPNIQVADGRSLNDPNMPGMPDIPEPGPTRTGQIFTHWEVTARTDTTTSPAIGVTFDGDTIVSGGNITITARWHAARTVTFDLAGGNIDGNTANVLRNVADGMSLTHPNMPGMPDDPEWFGRVFLGWEVVSRTGTGSPVLGADFDGDTIVSGGNVTVRAQWQIPVGHLSGHVLRADDQTTPIPGADVFVMNASGNIVATAIAGADGEFTITGLAPGTYTVFASATGFNTNFSVPNPVVLTATAGAVANVYLDEGPYSHLLLVDVLRNNDVGPQTRITGAAASFEGTGLTNPASANHFWALPMTAPGVGNVTASAIGYQTGSVNLAASDWIGPVVFVQIVLAQEPEVEVTFIPVANGTLAGGTPNVVAQLPWNGGVLTTAQIPTPQPNNGFEFQGWFTAATGGTAFDFAATITTDTNVYARFAPKVEVTFIPVANGTLAGGTPNVVVELPWDGGVLTTAQIPTPQPNNGFEFQGWFTAATGGTAFDFAATITTDTNVYARFAPKVEVTFIPVANGTLAGGTPNVVVELPWDGGVLTTAQIPTPQPNNGFEFQGWFTAATGGTAFDFAATITTDTNVYARFAPKVEVTFIPLANGSVVGGTPNVVVQLPWDGGVLTTAQIPAPQANNGFYFAGWYTAPTGGVAFDFTATITEDTNVYARFAPPVHVTFIPVANGSLAGGTPNVVVTLPWYGGELTTAHRPTPLPNTNFHFVGWFTQPTGGTAFGFPAMITEDTNVYARFALNNDDPGNIPGNNPGAGGPTTIQAPPVPLGPFVDEHIWYVRGYPDGSFRPGNSITRAEISMILWRLLDSNAKNAPQANRFADVQANSWYAQAVNYLAHRNVVTGFPDGNFHPNAPITRAELTAMMSRFFELQGHGGSTFNDVAGTHWAITYINNAHNRGWVTGFEDGTFRPNNATSRAEAVTLINRVLNRTPNPETISYWVEGFTFTDRDTLFNDITNTHWAYYQIKEAAIEHEYEFDAAGRELWSSVTIPWLNTLLPRH